ncbi:MAG: hypothetical protein NXI07_05300 [bacterium]|nr:hypothetical protein [bacterium]
MPPSRERNPNSTPSQFRSKLGTYLTGVAIGFTLLGMIYFFKHQAVQREQARQDQSHAQQDTGEPSGAKP